MRFIPAVSRVQIPLPLRRGNKPVSSWTSFTHCPGGARSQRERHTLYASVRCVFSFRSGLLPARKSPSRYFFMAQEDAEFLYFTTNMKRKEKPAWVSSTAFLQFFLQRGKEHAGSFPFLFFIGRSHYAANMYSWGLFLPFQVTSTSSKKHLVIFFWKIFLKNP